MFSSLHSAPSTGPKFSHNNSSKNYSPPVPARFSVHVFKKPPFGANYPNNVKLDAGYRSIAQAEPQVQGWYQPRYDERFSVSHPPPLPPPLPRHAPPSVNLSRGYEPTRPRNSVNFNIYPSATQNTFIYEQSLCSKSDIFSVSDLDSASTTTFSPALSTDSTLTLQDAETPLIADAPPNGVSVERVGTPAARRGSLVIHGQVPTDHGMSPSSGEFRSRPGGQDRSSTPFQQRRGPSLGVNDRMVSLARTPSESDIEARERIAVANAQYNSASTGSFYTSSPASSKDQPSNPHTTVAPPPAFGMQHPSIYISQDASLRAAARPEPIPQPYFPEAYVHNSPEGFLASQKMQNEDAPLSHVPLPVVSPSVSQSPSPRSPARPDEYASTYSDWSHPAHTEHAYTPSAAYTTDSYVNSRPPPAGSSYTRYSSVPPEPTSSYDDDRKNDRYADRSGDRSAPPARPAMNRQNSTYRDRRSSTVGDRPDLGALKPSRDAAEDALQRRPSEGALRRSPDSANYGVEDAFLSREKSLSADYPEAPSSSSSSQSSRSDTTKKDFRRRNSTIEPLSSSYGPHKQPHLAQQHPVVPARTPSSSPPAEKYYKQSPPDMHNRDIQYGSPVDPTKMRSRTSSMSHSSRSSDLQTTPPKSTNPDSLSMSTLVIHDDPAFERRHRRPDLAIRTTAMSNPPASEYYGLPTSQPPYAGETEDVRHRRRVSVVSQVSDAGSAMTTTTVNSPASALPSGPRSQTPFPPRHPDSHRRLSDSDESISDVPSAHRGTTPHQRSDRPPAPLKEHIHPPHHPEPQRRYSDGDQNIPHKSFLSGSGRASVPPMRSVRWNENLVCPSPVLPAERRKGWFNRRGDQLWTNDGVFRAAPADQQYPEDLDDYPESGEGWMNEEGVRIDMEHRRIPKIPRRSALKQIKN